MLLTLLMLMAQTGCDPLVIEGAVETPTKTHGAIAISGRRIRAIGMPEEMPGAAEGCILKLPKQQRVFPGLTDSHVHLLGIGLREMTLNLDRARSIEDVKRALRAAAQRQPEGTIIGRGWIETGWPEGRPLNKSDLDAVVDDRPVLLTRADGHALVANSVALRAVGITKETESPAGGRIFRDEKGEATGYLVDAAMGLVDRLIPKLDSARRREALRRGAQVYAARGWTSVHNMSVEAEDLPILEELAMEGELPLRVANFVDEQALPGLIERGGGCDRTGLVCHIGVKFYADGALGSRGALLKEPYEDDPETRGLRLLERGDALAAYRRATEAGLQVTTHAIGDQANADVLSWYEQIRKESPRAVLRVEHAQIVDPEDWERFSEIGVIASMQPSHAIGDLHFAEERLGPERLRGAYAWNSLASRGTLIVFGSDAPVEQGDPRIELYAASKRRDLQGFRGEGWRPGEALSRAETLSLFTTAPALAIGRGGALGTLAPSFAADLSIFEGDPFAGPGASEPVSTMIDGRFVTGRYASGAEAAEAGQPEKPGE